MSYQDKPAVKILKNGVANGFTAWVKKIHAGKSPDQPRN